MNARVKPPALKLALEDVILDPELQPRATLDRSTWEEYLYLLGDGVELPPVTVFRDGASYWLADGYHRWHAHKAVGATTISASVTPGSREEALRFSLSANATHGRRREAGDYEKAYQTACRHGFVKPEDTEGVQAIIHCSMRTAYDLTLPARAQIEADRDAEIAAKKAEGKTERQIAKETGLAKTTVHDAVGRIPQAAKTDRPGELPLEQPDVGKPEMPGLSEFREMTSPRGERWWAALRSLEKVGEQASVDELLSDRSAGLDHLFEPALRAAHSWITELHRRYFDD